MKNSSDHPPHEHLHNLEPKSSNPPSTTNKQNSAFTSRPWLRIFGFGTLADNLRRLSKRPDPHFTPRNVIVKASEGLLVLFCI